jgi:Txe/YoeB family toxin of Txe-Axe toxin-antitoxin module
MNKVFTAIAWEEYLYRQTENKQILKRINELIKDSERHF